MLLLITSGHPSQAIVVVVYYHCAAVAATLRRGTRTPLWGGLPIAHIPSDLRNYRKVSSHTKTGQLGHTFACALASSLSETFSFNEATSRRALSAGLDTSALFEAWFALEATLSTRGLLPDRCVEGRAGGRLEACSSSSASKVFDEPRLRDGGAPPGPAVCGRRRVEASIP